MRVKAASYLSTTFLLSAALVACGGSSDAGGDIAPSNDGDAGAQADVANGGHDASMIVNNGDAGSGGQDASSGGDSGGTHNDAGGGTDSGGGTDGGAASHPPFPQLASSGGPVMASPKVVGVFFNNYDLTDYASAMLNGLPSVTMANGEQFWSSSVAEYGVGALTVLPAIKLAEAAPSTDTDPQAFLTDKINNDPAFASVDTNTIVALFYPSTTPLGGSCAAQTPGYGGYHDSLSAKGGEIPYAVMAECANFGGLAKEDMVTVAGSHEIVEAVTDPYPSSNPAYGGLDNSDASWAMTIVLQGNVENGDMCTINAGFGRPQGQPWLLQRGWSNKAAKAGNADPCAPDVLPSQPFVGAYPVMPDTASIIGQNGPAVKIAAGQSRTIDIKCFSFQQTQPFTLTAKQRSTVNPPQLGFAFDKSTCVDGETVHLTITVMTAASSGHEGFILYAQLPNATDAQKPAWAGIVTQK